VEKQQQMHNGMLILHGSTVLLAVLSCMQPADSGSINGRIICQNIWPKRPELDGPTSYKYAQNKIAGVTGMSKNN